MSIVTVNRGGQGAPFMTSPPEDPANGCCFFEDFLGNAGNTFTFGASGFVVKAQKSGVAAIATEAGGNSTAISKSEVFSDLGDGESYAFNCRVRATTARANLDEISFGIAEDVAATIGSTATHCGFHVTQGATAAADNIAVKFAGQTEAQDISTNFTQASGAPTDFDATAWNNYGFLIQREGTQYRIRYFAEGKQLGNDNLVTDTVGDELYIAIFSTSAKGIWEIDWCMSTGPRVSD